MRQNTVPAALLVREDQRCRATRTPTPTPSTSPAQRTAGNGSPSSLASRRVATVWNARTTKSPTSTPSQMLLRRPFILTTADSVGPMSSGASVLAPSHAPFVRSQPPTIATASSGESAPALVALLIQLADPGDRGSSTSTPDQGRGVPGLLERGLTRLGTSGSTQGGT